MHLQIKVAVCIKGICSIGFGDFGRKGVVFWRLQDGLYVCARICGLLDGVFKIFITLTLYVTARKCFGSFWQAS